MKKIHVVGVIAILVVIALGIVTALESGEKSPIYVEGKISLAPELVEQASGIRTLYVTLYDAESPMPMPYGAMKEQLEADAAAGPFFDFYVTKEKLQTMRPDAPVPHKLRVKVRLDKDGFGGMDQPGDLTGSVEGVELGSQDVAVTIDHVAGSDVTQ